MNHAHRSKFLKREVHKLCPTKSFIPIVFSKNLIEFLIINHLNFDFGQKLINFCHLWKEISLQFYHMNAQF